MDELLKMTDEHVRKEYCELMVSARKVNARGDEASYEDLRKTLLNGTDYSKAVVAEMTKRSIRGIAHEDGRFDYVCGQMYCRCSD